MTEECQIRGMHNNDNNTTTTATSATTVHALKAITCSSTLLTAPSICIAVTVSIGAVDVNPKHEEILAQLTVEVTE